MFNCPVKLVMANDLRKSYWSCICWEKYSRYLDDDDWWCGSLLKLMNSIKSLKIKTIARCWTRLRSIRQSSSTLSGGEAQRIKLASFLVKGATKEKHYLSLTNQPRTAFPWYQETFSLFNALIDKGHSILVIEHNLDLIKCADWIIDLGPEGGENGDS
jgi:excinuclease UvrABC ATPase subunit